MNSFKIKRKQNVLAENNQRRTEALFDAVVAIAMTMIALEIKIPEQNVFLSSSLHMLFGEITTYFISFIVLASIWSTHTLIYSYYTSLGSPLEIAVNIILMFFITLFPVMTKLMSAMNSGFLLNLVYLGCYAIMEILVCFLLVLARRKNNIQRMTDIRNIINFIDYRKDKTDIPNREEILKKLQFIEKYVDEPTVFKQKYDEFIKTLPSNIAQQIKQQEKIRKEQYYTFILLNIISFIAVLLSVLTMMINKYLCYIIILASALLFTLCRSVLNKKAKTF